MKTEAQVLNPSTSLSHSGNQGLSPLSLISQSTGYMPSIVAQAWPPAVPKNAEFLPLEDFKTPYQYIEVKRTFEVTIRQAAYNRMMYYVMNAPGEVSGFGKVTRVGNSFTVEDVIVLEQKNSGVSSDISEGTLEKFMKLMKKRGLDTEGYDLWWHSHNDFAAYFSQTDLDTIEELRTNRFTLSIVTNKMLEPQCRVDFYTPVRYGIQRIPLKVLPAIDEKSAAALKAEMDMLLKTPRRRK